AAATRRSRRSLRLGDDVGHHAGGCIPRLPQTCVQDGTPASPLRARRMAGVHRHRSFLDHRRPCCGARPRALLRGVPREGWAAGMSELTGKNAVVLGLARSGEAAARALLEAGSTVTVLDAADEAAQRERALRITGARAVLGRMDTRDVAQADLVVASPGVPWSSA